jgi:cobalt-zinc-cadmium efflux system membrane fusion protein
VRPALLIFVALAAVAGCSSEKKEAPVKAGAKSPVSQAAAPAKPEEHAADSHEPVEGADHAHDAAPGTLVALTPVERENIGLKTVQAALRPLDDVRRVLGAIRPHPDRVALVTSRTPGKIVNIHAKIGERVAKGQDLIEVQSVEVEKLESDLIQAENKYRSERAKLELDLGQAENKLRLAQAELDRTRALVEKGIGARKDLIAAENQLQAVQNEIAGTRRQLELQAQGHQNDVAALTRQLGLLGLPAEAIERVPREKSVTLLHIPAPLGGVIVERPVSLGQVVETITVLFRIIDDSVVIAEGDAFEDLLPVLRVGQRVRVTAAAYPSRAFQGTLTFIHPVIDPEKRTAHIWAQIPNPDHQLKQDMFVQLNVVIGGGEPVVAVPAEAIIAAEGQEFVFVEREGGFARMPIAAGARNDQFVEVRRGLKAGDRVVTNGKRQVYTKMLAMRGAGAALGTHTH